MKVMTFNLRTSRAKNDGINCFANRKQKILDAIYSQSPSLIGFQEVTNETRVWLPRSLGADYTVIGCGREQSFLGEGVSIAYKNEEFSLVDFKTLWLSDTPTVAGSRLQDSDQSIYTRVYVKARLCRVSDGKIISFYNVHLDNEGKDARIREAEMICKDIKAEGGDFVLVGDFNERPEGGAYKIFARELDGVLDATRELDYTFHAFGKPEEYRKIDYIFTSLSSSMCRKVPDSGDDGIYISDHFPVEAELTW